MALCRRQCKNCQMRVTVLLESAVECSSLAAIATEMMASSKFDDMAVILRVGGVDVASQCSSQRAGVEEVSLW